MGTWAIRFAVAGLVLAVGTFGGAWLTGTIATRPARTSIGPPPADLPAETVEVASESGSRLASWLVRGQPKKGVVILMHGVRGNRLQMLDRARFLHGAGFSVLLFDFQASGESGGRAITFGHLEARDARAVFDFVRQRFPGERIGVIGMSMGGAAAVLAEPPLEAAAMVLEQVFATFDDAVKDRLQIYMGSWARSLAPGLTAQMYQRIGVGSDDLRPVDVIGRLGMPKLLIAGGADRHATVGESRLLFERANEPKEFWLVPGAAHIDLHRYVKADYEHRVGTFLARTLMQD